MGQEDERIKEAFSYAKKAGLHYIFETSNDEHIKHPNTVEIIVEDEKGRPFSIVGSSIGGGAISIDKVNGMEVFFDGEYETLFINHEDRTGVVAHITQCLSEWQINIAYMRSYRQAKGEVASTIIETDQPICDEVLAAIMENSAVQYAKKINL